jgi:hypothetical protein
VEDLVTVVVLVLLHPISDPHVLDGGGWEVQASCPCTAFTNFGFNSKVTHAKGIWVTLQVAEKSSRELIHIILLGPLRLAGPHE